MNSIPLIELEEVQFDHDYFYVQAGIWVCIGLFIGYIIASVFERQDEEDNEPNLHLWDHMWMKTREFFRPRYE